MSQVEGFYISEISTKMRLASHTHGSVIPWNTLNFIQYFIDIPKMTLINMNIGRKILLISYKTISDVGPV